MLDADHFATLSHPEAYTALTIELIEHVRHGAASASPVTAAAPLGPAADR